MKNVPHVMKVVLMQSQSRCMYEGVGRSYTQGPFVQLIRPDQTRQGKVPGVVFST